MQTIVKSGNELKKGDRINFWCFGDTPAEITAIFPIRTPFPFVTHCMRVAGVTGDGKHKSVEASIERDMLYTVHVD